MSTFALLLICAQACLVQNVYSQACWRGAGAAYGPGLAGPATIAEPFAFGYGAEIITPSGYAPGAYGPYGLARAPGMAVIAADAYGGEGIGDLAIAGELPVAGTTIVAGQVPIMGAVRFGGDVPAGGSVSIAGSCGCGNRAYY